jgi:integrase
MFPDQPGRDVTESGSGGQVKLRRLEAELAVQLDARVPLVAGFPCLGLCIAPIRVGGGRAGPGGAHRASRWTAGEAARFLAATDGDQLGLMFRIAVLRGARRGELCGLRWASADLDAGVLVVDRTILELDGHLVEGKPKTKAGERRIYLDKDTAGLLKAHRKAQLAARMRAGSDWQDNDLIFAPFDGTPWRPSYVSRRFATLAQAAGVPVIKLLEARHSAISLMRDAGVDRDVRMREAGHADAQVADRYTHILDAAHRAAAEQVAALVAKAGNGS